MSASYDRRVGGQSGSRHRTFGGSSSSNPTLAAAQQMPFVKMQATGNDFILIDGCRGLPMEPPKLALMLCDRNFGVGADGLLVLEVSTKADYRMSYYNADGGAAMCGNGACCLARFIVERGMLPGGVKEFELETLKGVLPVKVFGGLERVRIEMGSPVFEGAKIPVAEAGEQLSRELEVAGERYTISAVGMGNPHCVLVVDEVEGVDLGTLGPLFEQHAFFPQQTNLEIVQILDRRTLKMRVWERGVGETLACGTGECAVLAALASVGKTERQVSIRVPGGEVEVAWSEQAGSLFLTVPAQFIYEAEINLVDLNKQFEARASITEGRSNV